MHIKEETPVTTTNNGGTGLVTPEMPIVKNNIFKRIKDISDKQKFENKTKLKNS